MAGSISLSLSQQFDTLGNLLSGGRAYFIQAGTVATPQNAFQDLGLTQPWPNYYTLLANARLPQLYFADGYIKVRITDKKGVEVFNQDNIPVTGPSSGGGGGGGVDPTTVLQTGWLVPIYGTGVVTGFVRTNARTIGNASSGATERANADTSALFAWLWNADANLSVSGGRGVSAAADYAANKTIALPDWRGRTLAGLDDMGNTASGRLTTSYFGATATVLGASGGVESLALSLAQLPTGIISANATQAITVNYGTNIPGTPGTIATGTPNSATGASMPNSTQGWSAFTASIPTNNSIAVTSNNTSGSSHRTVQPTMLATIYLKL